MTDPPTQAVLDGIAGKLEIRVTLQSFPDKNQKLGVGHFEAEIWDKENDMGIISSVLQAEG
jgi:hypothetical protein